LCVSPLRGRKEGASTTDEAIRHAAVGGNRQWPSGKSNNVSPSRAAGKKGKAARNGGGDIAAKKRLGRLLQT